jgi:hypothetical protein
LLLLLLLLCDQPDLTAAVTSAAFLMDGLPSYDVEIDLSHEQLQRGQLKASTAQ